jgi:hypothetical protein
MYQHHIILKTADQLDPTQALAWYKAVKEFGPESIVFNYSHGDHSVAMEYGVCDCDEFAHCYTVPLTRDLTESETQFIINAWEYLFPLDFDIEISNQYDDQKDYDISLDEEIASRAVTDMKKWHHNRWVSEMSSAGWRTGAYFSESNKTHPALRDWDSLPESHRRSPEFTDKEVVAWLRRNKSI